MSIQRHQNILNREESGFIVVDIQERFEKVIPEFLAITNNIIKLLKGTVITSLESILFEWVEIYGTPEFKFISGLVK